MIAHQQQERLFQQALGGQDGATVALLPVGVCQVMQLHAPAPAIPQGLPEPSTLVTGDQVEVTQTRLPGRTDHPLDQRQA